MSSSIAKSPSGQVCPPDEGPTERRVAWLLNRLNQSRRAEQAGAKLGAADRRLIWLFQDQAPRTLREISDALGLEQSTVNRQVNAAITAGLLTRLDDAAESRAKLITVTQSGLDQFEANLQRLLRGYADALEAVEGDHEQFLADLERFVDRYEQIVS